MRTRGIAIAAALALTACGKDSKPAGDPPTADPKPPVAAPADAGAAASHPQPELAPGDLAKKRESYATALSRGRKLIDDKKAADAVAAFDAALAARPGDATALSELSWAAFSSGDHKRAIEAATASVAATTDPSLQAASLYNRGRAHEAHDDKAAATADYQASYRLRPHKVVRARLEALGADVPESVWTATVLAGPFATVEDFCNTTEGCQETYKLDKLDPAPIGWLEEAKSLRLEDWDDDNEGFVNSLAFDTADGWFVLRNFERNMNRMNWSVERVEVAGDTVAIVHYNEWGRFETDNTISVTVCGVGASGRPSCLGPIALADWFIGYEGSKEDGHELPAEYGAKCDVKLVAADRLEIKAADAGCRKKVGFAGEHELEFP